MKHKTEPAIGWGMRVGGGLPYLAYDLCNPSKSVAEKQCTEKYHRPIRVVLITLTDYRKLARKKK